MKCSVENCDREATERGMCHTHCQRWRYFGGTNPKKPIGAKKGRWCGKWKGGTFKSADGRILVLCRRHPRPDYKGGYVFRYRLVMEKHIGRLLLPTELVHHKNGKKDDDKIENLEIMSQSQHTKHHHKDMIAGKMKKKLNDYRPGGQP